MQARDIATYAVTVLVWGLSWFALKAQLDVVAAEVSGFYRFAIAAGIMWIWAALAGTALRAEARDHLRFAGLGFSIFFFNFLCFYHAAHDLPSGVLSVVFALAAALNIVLGAAIHRAPVERKVAVGASLGVLGVGLVFWPKIAGSGLDASAARGLGLSLLGTLSFCLGNMLMVGARARGLPIVAVNAWGMTWGTGFFLVASLIGGHPFIVDWSLRYGLSILWLSVFASVIAFAAYQDLIGRIGAARAGYSTVLYPVVALAVSTLFEDYRWTLAAALGIVMVFAGNVLVLRR